MLIGKRVSEVLSIFNDDRFSVVAHTELIGEFEEVARRTKFRKYFPEHAVDAFVQKFNAECAMIKAELNLEKISRDPDDDDYLLALCKTAKAQVLLTGDEDLLVLEKHGRTRTMTAREFVQEHFG